MPDMDLQWLVAVTQSNRERTALENVRRQGWEGYLPVIGKMIFVGPRHARKKVVTKIPLFPRYLFIRTDGTWRFLTGTFGVVGAIMLRDSPAVVPDRIIEQLKEREKADGMIELPSKPQFTVGAKVKITDGPFKDWVGVYQGQSGKERERVLLDMLGRSTSAVVSAQHLDRVE